LKALEIAREAAATGGKIVADYYHNGVEIRSKESYNLVSDADIEAEHAIVEIIRSTFPDHAIMGEESYEADASAEQLWVIDPIDGTNNFAHAIPHFAISVGYYENGQPKCGVVYNPIRNDWFTATRGGGACHNDQPIQVAEATRLEEVLVGVGFYYDRGLMMEATLAALKDLFQHHIHGIRRFGTASLDLCQVASGQFGAYFEYELSPWDYAAGRLIVEEAGGRVTTCGGEAVPLAKTSMLATNGRIHDLVLGIVQQHLP